jgi:hypothetical protein
MGDIIRKLSHILANEIREKENTTYDKSPKHYHNNLKINAGIKPRARDQARVTALTHPSTKEIQTTPQEVISIVTKHYELEQKRATRERLPDVPWTQTQNPDNFTMRPTTHTHPHPQETLNTCITKKSLRQSNKPSPSRQGTRT